ncbi:hypothetical protein FEE96_12415 [Parasedimentitalea maritima]|uniref:Uncharacterized protein n=1 Tax=Parasedimentitalea maritima TaxID=2578117 RepID=A0ABY2UV28_9RHOB|nr:hypothetical protein [Zongyanglinia marina]TLP64560.1 hypothetical protein FEE96_12415 [Zongyanglinia marina]
MNGVVLWSDVRQHKAVIWCEDQGDLAFYSQKQPWSSMDLHEGDLVCFDLTLQHKTRLAVNPQVLEEAACAGLAQRLTVAGPIKPNREQPASDLPVSAQVIPFEGSRRRNGANACRAVRERSGG